MAVTNVDEALSEVLDLIDRLGDPEKMTAGEFCEFLDELIGDLQIRKEAADQEKRENG